MFTLDKSNDGVCWLEHWKYNDLLKAKQDAIDLYHRGYDVTIWDETDEKIFELNSFTKVEAA